MEESDTKTMQHSERNKWHLSRQRTRKLDKINENETHQTISLNNVLPPPTVPSIPSLRHYHSHSFHASKQKPNILAHNQHYPHSQKPIKETDTKMTELRSCISAPLLLAVQHSVGYECSKRMDDTTANAARKYYEMIVNDDTDYQHKKTVIYNDLVIGNKTELNMKNEELKEVEEFELKYKIGTESQSIESVKGSVLTVGRYHENDIHTGDVDEAVSRIQFFILVIGSSLIILDGWSFMGTQTIKVNNTTNDVLHSMPKKRYVLRFNRNDIIHLKMGQNIDLIINPKECVVCMSNARVVRNECGHYALCSDCFNHILSSNKAQCPVCRAELKRNNYVKQTLYSNASWCPM